MKPAISILLFSCLAGPALAQDGFFKKKAPPASSPVVVAAPPVTPVPPAAVARPAPVVPAAPPAAPAAVVVRPIVAAPAPMPVSAKSGSAVTTSAPAAAVPPVPPGAVLDERGGTARAGMPAASAPKVVKKKPEKPATKPYVVTYTRVPNGAGAPAVPGALGVGQGQRQSGVPASPSQACSGSAPLLKPFCVVQKCFLGEYREHAECRPKPQQEQPHG